MFSVRHGRVEIGVVPDEALIARPAGLAAGGAHVLVLAGRSWAVTHIDWPRRVVQVEPTNAPGVARWRGGGLPLGAGVARGVRDVLVGRDPDGVELSQRARARLAELRVAHPWAASGTTTVVQERGRSRWWTFAGGRANLWLARLADDLRAEVAAIDDLTIAVDPSATAADIGRLIRTAFPAQIDLAPWIAAEAIEGLKFAECLPVALAREVLPDASPMRSRWGRRSRSRWSGFEVQSTTPSTALPIEPTTETLS